MVEIWEVICRLSGLGFLDLFRDSVQGILSLSGGCLGDLLGCPVVDVIKLVVLLLHDVPEKLTEMRIVRLILKSQIFYVVHVLGELEGESLAELLDGGLHLFFHDSLVLILLIVSFEIHPGELSS